MDIEKLVTRLFADGSQYTRVMDAAVSTAQKTAHGITNAFGSLSGAVFGSAGSRVANSFMMPVKALIEFSSWVGRQVSSVLGAGLGMAGSIVGGAFGMAVNAAKIGLMALVAVAGIAAYKAIELAAEYEQAAISFEIMTGSAEKGKQVLDDISKMAVTTPFTSQQLTKTAVMLKGMSIETDQLIPTMRALGDVASGGAGGSLEERMQRISYAFGEVASAGRLTAYQLRQFTFAGVPIIRYLAEVMGEPEQQIRHMVEAGEVGFPQVVQAFNKMSGAGGMFANMMERQSKTVAGQWSNLKDQAQILLRNVGLAFFKGFGLSDILEQFSNAVANASGGTEQLESVFGRLRGVFDLFRAAVMAVGNELMNQIGGGSGFSWDNMEGVARAAIAGIITGIGKLLDILKQVGEFIIRYVAIPLVKAADAVGILDARSSGGVATTHYQRLRDQGVNKIGSLFGTLGGNAVDLVTDNALTEHLAKKGQLAPNQGQGARMAAELADMANNMGAMRPEDVASRMIADMDRRRQEFQNASRPIDRPIERMTKEQQAVMRKQFEQSVKAVGQHAGFTFDSKAAQTALEGLTVPEAFQMDPGVAAQLVDKHMRETKGTKEYYSDRLAAFNAGQIANPPKVDDVMSLARQQVMRDEKLRELTETVFTGERGATLKDLQSNAELMAQAMKNWATKTPGMDEFFAEADKAKAAAGQMAVPFQVSAKAMEAAGKIRDEMHKGVSHLEKFNTQMGYMNEAVGIDIPLMGRIGEVLSDQAAEYGKYKAFMELRKSVENRLENKLPPTALAGSVEAQNIINQSREKTENWQDEVLRVMAAAKDAQEEEVRQQGLIIAELRKLNVNKEPEWDWGDL